MQPGSPEHAAELEHLARKLAEAAGGTSDVLQHLTRQVTALTFTLVFLMNELEERGGLDRAAVAERTLAGLRTVQPEDPETEKTVRDLFCQDDPPDSPARARLRVIEGGKG